MKYDSEEDSMKSRKEDVSVGKDEAPKQNTLHLQDDEKDVCETELSWLVGWLLWD